MQFPFLRYKSPDSGLAFYVYNPLIQISLLPLASHHQRVRKISVLFVYVLRFILYPFVIDQQKILNVCFFFFLPLGLTAKIMDRTKTTADVYGAFYDFSRMLKSKVWCFRNQEAGLAGRALVILICEIRQCQVYGTNTILPKFTFSIRKFTCIIHLKSNNECLKIELSIYNVGFQIDTMYNFITKSPS